MGSFANVAPKFFVSVKNVQKSTSFLKNLPPKGENYIIVPCTANFIEDDAIEISVRNKDRLRIKVACKTLQEIFASSSAKECSKGMIYCDDNKIRIYNIPREIDLTRICGVRVEMTVCPYESFAQFIVYVAFSITQVYYKQSLLEIIKNPKDARCDEFVAEAIIQLCASFAAPLEIAHKIMSFIDVVYVKDYFETACVY